MELGMIGLGRMGAYMSQRLIRAGHTITGYVRHAETIQTLLKDGAITQGATSLEDLVKKLSTPRSIWLMVPAASVDATLASIVPHLAAGDIVIDGGNSYYHDDIRRAAELKARDIHYVDVGTSGGVWGLERGYCLMIGGEDEIVKHLDPVFATLAPGINAAARTPGREKMGGTAEQGYLHCGPNGAGHFVKMVHNGIEYGIMAAYAEGLDIIRNADIGTRQQQADAETAPLQNPEFYRYSIATPEVAEVWRRWRDPGSWRPESWICVSARWGPLPSYEPGWNPPSATICPHMDASPTEIASGRTSWANGRCGSTRRVLRLRRGSDPTTNVFGRLERRRRQPARGRRPRGRLRTQRLPGATDLRSIVDRVFDCDCWDQRPVKRAASSDPPVASPGL
jgi:6-phosphogluconate dehydrogenase